MTFNLNYLSQRDPLWKNDMLGFSNEYNLGSSGCALTSLTMLANGFGYAENPGGLNQKLKNVGGFIDAMIVWGAITSVCPGIVYKGLQIVSGKAPLKDIDASIGKGQPVIVQVDSSASPGLQTHWVVLYAKKGDDYLMLDPYPLPSDNKETTLNSRYSFSGKKPEDFISAIAWYEGRNVTAAPPTPPAPITETNMYVEVVAGIIAPGLRLRSQPTTSSETVAFEASGTRLRIIEAENVAKPKIGVFDQWVRVRDAQGLEGFVAAWYVQNVAASAPLPDPGTTQPVTTPPANPSAPANAIKVYVSPEVIPTGLRLRTAPNLGSTTLLYLDANAELIVLEDPIAAKGKIGVQDQWLNVKDAAGNAGYVAAWLVLAASSGSTPAPVSTIPQIKPGTDFPDNGIGALPLEAAASDRITPPVGSSSTTVLVADIWNRFGGMLGALSAQAGIDPAVGVAVLSIESGGKGFGADRRLLIRFEVHVFNDQWGKSNKALFDQYFQFGAQQVWTGHKWRPSVNDAWRDPHISQSGEWDVLSFASTLNDTAAKKSISMGLAQIMGFNHQMIGYSTVQTMFNAFAAGERYQIAGFFEFLKSANAIPALKAKDFKAFATIYNGTGQAEYYGNLISGAYNAFNAVKGSKAPATTTPQPVVATPAVQPAPVSAPVVAATPTAPVTTATSVTTPAPVTPASTDKEKLIVIVSQAVGTSGLRMRTQASQLATTVVVVPAGEKLNVLDKADVAKPKIGAQSQWLWVQDNQGHSGYVAAWYVSLAPAASTGVSFDVTSFVEEGIPVFVSTQAVGGLNLRSAPNTGASILKQAPINSELTALGEDAPNKIGVYNEWLKVRDASGTEGYAAAWYVHR
jgi:SH3-like domain-containing protein